MTDKDNIISDPLFINGHQYEISNNIVKTLMLKHEWNEDIADPEEEIKHIKINSINADLFSFVQRIPDVNPKYSYYMEWANFAVLPLESYKYWWEKQITQEARNKVRKAMKKGIEIKLVDFNDEFVAGIKEIYDESPIRQGKPFLHYKKDLKILKNTNETFLEKSCFIGAYFEQKLVGFIKLVSTDKFIRTFHVISTYKHRDKAPVNALMARAVEYCCEMKTPYLVYGLYDYGKVGSKSLLKFKIENGFIRMDYPRYYMPLNIKGKMGLAWGLHLGLVNLLPVKVIDRYKSLREKWYVYKLTPKK